MPGGKLKLLKPEISEGESFIHIQASSEKQLRQALKGQKRKYASINVEREINTAKMIKSYLPSMTIEMKFGGEDTKRALCKMAVNYYVYNGGMIEDVKHLLPYIQGDEQEVEFYFMYPKSELFYKGKDDVVHTLILIGDPKTKQLYVYIELFNEFKAVVYIDKEYNGDEIYESYHYNVVTNQVITYEEKVKIPPQQLKRYTSKNIDLKRFHERMKYLVQRIDNIVIDRRISEIISDGIKAVQEKYPQEEYPIFNEEMINFLANKIGKEFVLAFQNRWLKQEV